MSSGKVVAIQVTLKHLAKLTKRLSCVVKHVRDMTRTYSRIQYTDKYSQHSSIFWPVWLNGWVFVYELSGCGFESSCSHLNTRSRTCFEQGVPWHSGNCRVWIHSEMRTWHDKNIQWLEIVLIASFTILLILYLPNWSHR